MQNLTDKKRTFGKLQETNKVLYILKRKISLRNSIKYYLLHTTAIQCKADG